MGGTKIPKVGPTRRFHVPAHSLHPLRFLRCSLASQTPSSAAPLKGTSTTLPAPSFQARRSASSTRTSASSGKSLRTRRGFSASPSCPPARTKSASRRRAFKHGPPRACSFGGSETRTLYPELAVGEVTTSLTVEADTSAVNTTGSGQQQLYLPGSHSKSAAPPEHHMAARHPGARRNGLGRDQKRWRLRGQLRGRNGTEGQRFRAAAGSERRHDERQLCRGAVVGRNLHG